MNPDELSREVFLDVFARLYDRCREGGRAQLHHAAVMADRQLGGTVWIHLPSRPGKRDIPEAGYISDIPAGVPIA